MQIYNVHWAYDSSLGKGTGKLSSDKKFFDIVVLVRSRADALRAFEILFNKVHSNDGICPDDGFLTFNRCLVDSRNIFCNYLMLDGMKEPLYLTDIFSRENNLRNIFGIF